MFDFEALLWGVGGRGGEGALVGCQFIWERERGGEYLV